MFCIFAWKIITDLVKSFQFNFLSVDYIQLLANHGSAILKDTIPENQQVLCLS